MKVKTITSILYCLPVDLASREITCTDQTEKVVECAHLYNVTEYAELVEIVWTILEPVGKKSLLLIRRRAHVHFSSIHEALKHNFIKTIHFFYDLKES